MIDAEALRIAYDSEVCMDDFGQPRSAFLLLRYIPFAKTFLSCRKVTNIEAAQRIVENQTAPHHDIKFMAGFSLKNLLPPHPTSTAEVTASDDNPPRKRKAVERGSSSQPEARAETPAPSHPSPLSGVNPPFQPRMTLLGNVLDPTTA